MPVYKFFASLSNYYGQCQHVDHGRLTFVALFSTGLLDNGGWLADLRAFPRYS
jgi:hypothetical protein